MRLNAHNSFDSRRLSCILPQNCMPDGRRYSKVHAAGQSTIRVRDGEQAKHTKKPGPLTASYVSKACDTVLEQNHT